MKKFNYVLIIAAITIINVLCIFKIFSIKKTLYIINHQYNTCKVESEREIRYLVRSIILNANQNSIINNKVQEFVLNITHFNAVLLCPTGCCGSCVNYICEQLVSAGIIEKDIYVILEDGNEYLRKQLTQTNIFNINVDKKLFRQVSSDEILIVFSNNENVIYLQYNNLINNKILPIIEEMKTFLLSGII